MEKESSTGIASSNGEKLGISLVRMSRDYKEMLADQPIGLMYLGACARFRGGHEVKIHDFKLGDEAVQSLERDLRERRPQIVGLSAMTYESALIPELASRVKKLRPGAVVIVGGAHASVFPKEVLQIPDVDFVVIGEGEETFMELLSTLQNGGSFSQVRGMGFMSGSNPVLTAARPPIEDLDTLPFPAWDMIDVERYFDLPRAGMIIAHREYMAVFTSRSCGYKCIYCHNIFGHKYRTRSAENVIREFEILYKNMGIKEFHVLDDAFNLDLPRAKKICRLMIERKIKVKMHFPNGVRGDRLDDEAVELMAEAGMFRAQFSVETGSPRLQKVIHKYMNLEKIKHNIDYASRLGVMTHGAFMLGFPTETREELLQTIKFAQDSRLETAAFYRVIPFQGTELYEMVKDRLPASSDFTNYEYYTHDVNISELSDSELTRLQRSAYKRFYCSPRRMLRIIWRLPRKSLLLSMFGIFINRVWRR